MVKKFFKAAIHMRIGPDLSGLYVDFKYKYKFLQVSKVNI